MLKIAIWTDVDLDGAASYLVLQWILQLSNCNVSLHTCNTLKLRNEFVKWLEHNKISDYDKVFFLDLDASLIKDLIDFKNVTIVDHHKSHIDKNIKYTAATSHVRPCDSTAQLLYELYKSKCKESITGEQLKLILLTSDYDCYRLQFKDSKKLNNLFWTFNGNRVETFAKTFKDGFNGFNQLQENAIALYNKKVKSLIDELQMFAGNINEYSVVAVFCSTAHNDIAEYLINKYNAQIVMLVNMQLKTVSFRRSNSCTANVAELANKLCDGGGHETAAGGAITEKFLLFAKTLKPLQI